MKQTFNGHHIFDCRTILLSPRRLKRKESSHHFWKRKLSLNVFKFWLKTDTMGMFTDEIKRQNVPPNGKAQKYCQVWI